MLILTAFIGAGIYTVTMRYLTDITDNKILILDTLLRELANEVVDINKELETYKAKIKTLHELISEKGYNVNSSRGKMYLTKKR
jgi:peptidoglycan hydrolase CwlO-like protein